MDGQYTSSCYRQLLNSIDRLINRLVTTLETIDIDILVAIDCIDRPNAICSMVAIDRLVTHYRQVSRYRQVRHYRQYCCYRQDRNCCSTDR